MALVAAMSVNAQEVCSFDSEALGLNADGVALTAGTVLGQTESIICTVGADDTYKTQSVKATVGDQEINGGLQGSSNPKDADGGTPSGTLIAPVSGAYLQFEAKANGFLYVIHKASSNKAYTVFEEGEAIGYTYAAIGDAETDLGAVYQYTLQGAGEFNYLKDAGLTKVDWAEQEYLRSIGKYDSHVTTNEDGTTGWSNIAKGGIGVIKFAVYEGCKYIVNANGSKITAGGFYFDTTGNASVVSGDVTILAGEGGVTPTPVPAGDVVELSGETLNLEASEKPNFIFNGTEITIEMDRDVKVVENHGWLKGINIKNNGVGTIKLPTGVKLYGIEIFGFSQGDNWEYLLGWGNGDQTVNEGNFEWVDPIGAGVKDNDEIKTKAAYPMDPCFFKSEDATVEYTNTRVFAMNFGDEPYEGTFNFTFSGNNQCDAMFVLYLSKEAAATIKEATGIKTVKTGKAGNGIIYNLKGQKVGADYKGLVIKNFETLS